jgi:azurin
VAKVVLEKAAVSADQVEIAQCAVDVNMNVDVKFDRVKVVCCAVDVSLNVSQAMAEVVLKTKTGGAGESDSDGG